MNYSVTESEKIEKMAMWLYARDAAKIGLSHIDFSEISRMVQMRYRGEALALISIVRAIDGK